MGKRPVRVAISAIDAELRPASKMRQALDQEAIEAYSVSLKARQMPPVKLVHDIESKTYWVEDGAHTITAASRSGHKEVTAIVREGSFLDAYRGAFRANQTHGLRVKPADKRHAVVEFLGLPEAKKMTQRQVAEVCDVTQPYVSQLKQQIESHEYYINTSDSESDTSDNGREPSVKQRVAAAYADNPRATQVQVAEQLGVSTATVAHYRGEPGLAVSRSGDLEQGPTPESDAGDEAGVTYEYQFYMAIGSRRLTGMLDQVDRLAEQYSSYLRSKGGFCQLSRLWSADLQRDHLKKLREIRDRFDGFATQLEAKLCGQ
jgi:predicted transcriptional regulator